MLCMLGSSLGVFLVYKYTALFGMHASSLLKNFHSDSLSSQNKIGLAIYCAVWIAEIVIGSNNTFMRVHVLCRSLLSQQHFFS